MKKTICLLAGLLAFNLLPAFGQSTSAPPAPAPAPQLPPPDAPHFQQRLQAIVNRANSPEAPALTKFDLVFPGGPPTQLVKAIEKAMGKPLNAIISDEDANAQLPPLKMNHVDVAQLFQALEAASRKAVSVVNSSYGYGMAGSYSQQWTGYSFQTTSQPVSDDSIWYFHVEKLSLPPVISSQKVCRFYSLAPYLNRGFTVDDITTAIQTGWKMAGVAPPPELNYHKETKLLIAFGEPYELQTIQNVLDTLPAESALQTRSDLDRMNHQINQLQTRVDKLSEKISAPVPAAVPEEKSGK